MKLVPVWAEVLGAEDVEGVNDGRRNDADDQKNKNLQPEVIKHFPL